MAFILCILSWKECNRVWMRSQELHRLNLLIPLSLPLLLLCAIAYPLGLYPWVWGLHLKILQSFACVCGFADCGALLFVPFEHNTLVPFIASTYFTTFPAPEREEDQTSSVVNFLREQQPGECATQETTQTHTESGTETGDGVGIIIYHRRKLRFPYHLRIFTF